jgi:hypothetical protein
MKMPIGLKILLGIQLIVFIIIWTLYAVGVIGLLREFGL